MRQPAVLLLLFILSSIAHVSAAIFLPSENRVWKISGINYGAVNQIDVNYDSGLKLSSTRTSDYDGSQKRDADISGSIDGAAGIGGLLEVFEKKGSAATRSLPIYDGIGNIVGLVDGTTGARVATYQYGPFGELLGVYGALAASCPFRFQTRLYDDETGLSYFGKRYYDARTQTWLSRDPLREDGGINLYAYCSNDPIAKHDPIGLADSFFELLFPAYSGRDDLVQTARESGLYAVYGTAQIPGKVVAKPKVQGSMRMAGGALEIGTGIAYSAATGGAGALAGGGLIALNGTDNFYAGLQTFRLNSYQPAVLESGITSVAGDGVLGNSLYAATQLGAGFAPALAPRAISGLGSVGERLAGGGMLPGNVYARQAGSVMNPIAELGGDAAKTKANALAYTFRGDARAPSTIFNEGFSARGTSTDLFSHALDNMRPPSAFISTSKSFDVASDFGSSVYVVRPRGGIDVNSVLGPRSPFPSELEVAVPFRIAPQDIRAVTRPQEGMSILNPNWQW